eukprot:539514_1
MWNNLAEPLLTDNSSLREQSLTFFNPMEQKVQQQLELHRMSSNPVKDVSDDSDDDDSKSRDSDDNYVGVNTNETIRASTSSTNATKNDGIESKQPENIPRRTTAKIIIDEDIVLSKKYYKYLTLDNDEIIDKNDKIDALILQLKLPHIYTLLDDEQYAHILKCYSWIDDEDGDIDQFQYEILQEVVANMTSIERRYMYDTIAKYNEDDEDIKLKYRLIPAKLKTMKRYKKMKENRNNAIKRYVCCGCGVLLKNNVIIKKKKNQDKFEKYSKSWRGYICAETQREFIFHHRLCVKFRKAKEWIRDAVHKYNIENGILNSSKMQIDFLKNEGLDIEFQPSSFYTTFDETQKKAIKYTKNIRKYYRECVSTDLRGYDIDEGDRFSNIPIEIKYLDQREFAIPMFKYLIREVQIKEFNLFWEIIQFFTSYIDTPKLISLLAESSDILFPLHDDTHTGDASESNELINFLTIICEGALYPIATCLYISAYIKENGENYWNEDETESLSKHFTSMANSIIDEIESEHLVAIVLETPTNIYEDDDEICGLSVIDIAIKYKMLRFLQNNKISRIATTLWYERKIIHPKKRFGDEVTWWDLFERLCKTPNKFYFSQSGLGIVRCGLYCMYLGLFSYVTLAKRYNYEQPGAARDSNYILWLFNIAAILYEAYRCFTTVHIYFSKLANITEFIKAILWIIMFIMRWIFPAQLDDCLYFVKSEDPFYFDCGQTLSDIGTQSNNKSLSIGCNKLVYREDPIDCSQQQIHNSLSVEIYMGLWAIQCVLFWVSLAFYFQRSRSVGPLLRMIALMTQDMINFLILVIIFWIAISLALYYVVSDDLGIDSEYGKLTGSITSCLFYGMLTFFGTQEWELVSNTADIIGTPRSLILDMIVCFASVIGTILLLNLLIAMLGNTYNELNELSVLEVNYTRVVQSYNASKDISLIPPPLNYFAFILMSFWFLCDWLITACTCGKKMLNDWYFTPINTSVFSAGDFIDYKDENGQKNSGFVQHTYTSEIAEIQVAGKNKFVHKNDILKIQKEILTERLSDTNSNGICSSITSSGRYYCKYCRFLFHGDQVGNVEQIKNLFRFYGIVLDEDDIGKLGNMLGDNTANKKYINKTSNNNNNNNNNNDDDDDDECGNDIDNYNKNLSLRKLGVAQLCPECYRPFYCSEDHFDEVKRLQYLSEICSFWVFLIVCYVPLVGLFAIPALISWIGNIIITKSISNSNNTGTGQIKMCENNDKYRAMVVDKFDEIRPLNDYVDNITKRLNHIHKKIRESKADDEEDNIITQTQEKLSLQKLVLTPKEGKQRMKQLRQMHKEWSIKLDNIIQQIKEKKKKEKKKNKERFQMY